MFSYSCLGKCDRGHDGVKYCSLFHLYFIMISALFCIVNREHELKIMSLKLRLCLRMLFCVILFVLLRRACISCPVVSLLNEVVGCKI
jgi:hypothetical protein